MILVHKLFTHGLIYCECLLPSFFGCQLTARCCVYTYPKSVIKKFGHADIFALLGATKIRVEVVSIKVMGAIFYSAYNKVSTMYE